MIRTLEELSMNAWPALETVESDGWVLRFSEGYTRRANSVHPLGPGTRNLVDKIQEAERQYRERDLRPTFKMTTGSLPHDLDGALAERGYKVEAGTTVQVADAAWAMDGAVRIDASWDASQE